MCPANRRFKFKKHSQLFIRTHHEPLSVAAMRVSNPGCLSVRIEGRDTAPTPTGFAEIKSFDQSKFAYEMAARP
jgi:hypothetical protein